MTHASKREGREEANSHFVKFNSKYKLTEKVNDVWGVPTFSCLKIYRCGKQKSFDVLEITVNLHPVGTGGWLV